MWLISVAFYCWGMYRIPQFNNCDLSCGKNHRNIALQGSRDFVVQRKIYMQLPPHLIVLLDQEFPTTFPTSDLKSLILFLKKTFKEKQRFPRFLRKQPTSKPQPKRQWSWKSCSRRAWPWPNLLQEPPWFVPGCPSEKEIKTTFIFIHDIDTFPNDG